MKKIIDFVVKSSADPKAVSLSVKAFLVFLLSWSTQALDVVCNFGQQCYSFDPNIASTVIEAIATGTFYLFSLTSALITIYGLGRKLYRTVTGNNLALQDSE